MHNESLTKMKEFVKRLRDHAYRSSHTLRDENPLKCSEIHDFQRWFVFKIFEMNFQRKSHFKCLGNSSRISNPFLWISNKTDEKTMIFEDSFCLILFEMNINFTSSRWWSFWIFNDRHITTDDGNKLLPVSYIHNKIPNPKCKIMSLLIA